MGCSCKSSSQNYHIGHVIKDELTRKPGRYADTETVSERRELCASCNYKLFTNCLKCGCFIKAKTKYSASTCPVGKW